MSFDIDEAKVERNPFGLWLGWTLATTLGMILGYLPAAYVIQDVELGIARILVPLLAGILVGFAQWIVLRGYVTSSYDWILNHAGGWVVGYIIGLFVVQWLARFPLGALIGFMLFGAIVAIFQWPVLRREIPHLWSWVLANVVGWTLGAYASQLIMAALNNGSRLTLATSTILSVGITALVAGAITAVALIWIVRKPERPVYP